MNDAGIARSRGLEQLIKRGGAGPLSLQFTAPMEAGEILES
jgi:hypothetical protein